MLLRMTVHVIVDCPEALQSTYCPLLTLPRERRLHVDLHVTIKPYHSEVTCSVLLVGEG